MNKINKKFSYRRDSARCKWCWL